MRRTAAAFIIALALAGTAAAQGTAAQEPPDLQGKLYKTVFVQGAGTLTHSDLAELPESVRARLQRVLERRSAFKSRLKGGASDPAAVAVEAKKRRLEAGIVALLDAPGIEQLAADFAESATVAHQWDGGPDGPLGEAAGAEDFLKRDPATPLAPYLYVLIAARQRAAFETMKAPADKAAMAAAAKKYRTFMQRARAAGDPVFRLLADDMERLPYLHVKSEHHPRDFDPDS